MRVVGPTLELRFAKPADAGRLFELGSDPEVTRFFSWGPYDDERQALAYIESLRPRRESGQLLEFVIDHRDEGIVGVTGLSELSARDRRAVIGTWLGRAYWGSGLNLESKALVTKLAFDALSLHRLTALTSPENGRSLRALERLGFVREGTLVDWHRHGHEHRDCVILRMLERDYRASPLAELSAKVLGEPPPSFTVR